LSEPYRDKACHGGLNIEKGEKGGEEQGEARERGRVRGERYEEGVGDA
jgi:hypothetical protein